MHSRLKVFTKLFSVISDILPILNISKTSKLKIIVTDIQRKGFIEMNFSGK